MSYENYREVTKLYDASIRELVVSASEGWTANNPSIALGPEGYRFTVRSSNFVLDPSGLEHQTKDPHGVIITRNYIGSMDTALRVQSLEPITYDPEIEESDCGWVRGVEDCRLFWDYLNQTWKTSGTFRMKDGNPVIAVDTLVGNHVADRGIYFDSSPQKNWMSTGRGDEFLKGPWDVDGLEHRGSSQAILVDGLYLTVLHFCTWPGRNYWHRMALFNMQGALRALGPVFYFIEPGVQFCNGLELWNNYAVLSFGYREARCFLAYIPYDQIMRSMSVFNGESVPGFIRGEDRDAPPGAQGLELFEPLDCTES